MRKVKKIEMFDAESALSEGAMGMGAEGVQSYHNRWRLHEHG